MSDTSENKDLSALLKEVKKTYSLLLIYGFVAFFCLLGAFSLFRIGGTSLSIIFMLPGIFAGCFCISQIMRYRNLKQQIAEKAEKDPDTAEKYNVFETNSNLRQYPFFLLLCIFVMAIAYFSGADIPVWYYIVMLAAISIHTVRYCVNKKKTGKALQEKSWENEEKEYYAVMQKQEQKTAIKAISIILAIAVGLACIIAYSLSSSTKHECGVCKHPARHKYGDSYYCSVHYQAVKELTEKEMNK